MAYPQHLCIHNYTHRNLQVLAIRPDEWTNQYGNVPRDCLMGESLLPKSIHLDELRALIESFGNRPENKEMIVLK